MSNQLFGWVVVLTVAVLFLWLNWTIPLEWIVASGLPEIIWHSLGYGLFGLLVLAVLRISAPRGHILLTVILALVAGGVVAVFDERSPSLLPGRPPQVSDLRWNAAGLLGGQVVGLVVYLVLRVLRPTRAE